MDDRIVVEDSLQWTVSSWTPDFVYFQILWKISNFVKSIDGVQYPKYIGSSKSVPIFSSQFSASLRVYPVNTGERQELSFFIHNDFESKDTWITYRLTIMNKDDEEKYEEDTGIIGNAKGGWGILDWIPSGFADEIWIRNLQENSLNISIKGLAWLVEPKIKQIPIELLKTNVPASLLSLKERKKDESYEVIISVEDKQFHVLKHVLSSASSAFQELFKTHTDNIIVITNVSSNVFREIIQFIYKGTFEVETEDLLKGLLKASHNYDLPLLKYICERKMMNGVKVCNAIEFLKVSSDIESEELEEFVMEFIVKNKKEILKDNSWVEFSAKPSDLVLKLCTKFMASD